MTDMHVAVIMDGNRRWARNKSLPVSLGHKKGADRLLELLNVAVEQRIKALTVYAWSRDNFQRSHEEQSMIFDLMMLVSSRFIQQAIRLDICVKHIGDLALLPHKVSHKLQEIEEKTKSHQGLKLFIAAAYSSRYSITSAVKTIAERVQSQQLCVSDISESLLDMMLRSQHTDAPNLLIRTSGECRLSDFLLWEIAYTEIYFCQKKWPDFQAKDFKDALLWYQGRQRRFGC